MSTQTEHIGLHQWESTDNFLREDFNEDNRKIDEKVGETEDKVGRALAGLEGVSYNIYNLLLQNYYEGKYTEYKRAMIFDGFINGEGLSVRSSGTWLEGQRLWYCGNMQPFPVEENFGTAAVYHINSGEMRTRSMEIEGHGEITGGSLYYSSGSSYVISIQLTCGSASAWKSINLPGTSGIERIDFALDTPLLLTPGKTLTMTVKSTEYSGIDFYGAAADDEFGCRLEGTGTTISDGICLTVPCDLGENYDAALAWIRYEGNAPQLAVLNEAGEQKDFILKATYSGLTLDGEACMEAEYALESPPGIPNSTVTLKIDLTQEGMGAVYDYGVIFQ